MTSRSGATLPDPADLEVGAPGYYRRLGSGRYRPTLHTQGAWQPGEQHLAALTGLIVHEVQAHSPRPELQPARFCLEVLGQIPAAETTITVHTARPGRTIELVVAEVEIGGRVVVRASIWRLLVGDTSEAAGGAPAPLPPPEAMPTHDATSRWPGGFIASLELRAEPSTTPGHRRVWLRAGPELVVDEPVSDLAALLGLVDTANGVAVRTDPGRWMFPNTDLTVHLHRQPTGGWLGLDTRQVLGATGVGLTSSTLYDLDGPVGRSEQILTLRPIPDRSQSRRPPAV